MIITFTTENCKPFLYNSASCNASQLHDLHIEFYVIFKEYLQTNNWHSIQLHSICKHYDHIALILTYQIDKGPAASFNYNSLIVDTFLAPPHLAIYLQDICYGHRGTPFLGYKIWPERACIPYFVMGAKFENSTWRDLETPQKIFHYLVKVGGL
ncbi:hypothetical protein VNO77_27915 [Canavalia gladiata]|uniref:Uncharacterized protein n=1 Tax=Canavalia gladiata TaxID=3824 RepID=A0AAN9Q4J0_CANGL